MSCGSLMHSSFRLLPAHRTTKISAHDLEIGRFKNGRNWNGAQFWLAWMGGIMPLKRQNAGAGRLFLMQWPKHQSIEQLKWVNVDRIVFDFFFIFLFHFHKFGRHIANSPNWIIMFLFDSFVLTIVELTLLCTILPAFISSFFSFYIFNCNWFIKFLIWHTIWKWVFMCIVS